MFNRRMVCFSLLFSLFFFFNDTATTEIYTLSLHDALPILGVRSSLRCRGVLPPCTSRYSVRSEEHTSELQSQSNLVCRLLLEKKKKKTKQLSATETHAHYIAATHKP